MGDPVIDSHVHVLPERVRRQRQTIAGDDSWFALCHAGERVIAGEHELLEYLDGDGIDRAIVVTWPFRDPGLCREANDFAADLARHHPDRVDACGIVNPLSADASAELRRIRDLGLRGVGELNADAQGFTLEDERLPALAQLSRDLGLFWMLHCSEPVGHAYPGKGTATPDRIVTLAERCEDLPIIAAHLGGGLPLYAHMPEVARLCRRLWFDTAALPFLYKPSALRDIAALIGADRILFGSDFPLLTSDRYRGALADSWLDDGEVAGIMGGNAQRLLDRLAVSG